MCDICISLAVTTTLLCVHTLTVSFVADSHAHVTFESQHMTITSRYIGCAMTATAACDNHF